MESNIARVKAELGRATNQLKFRLKPASFTTTGSVVIDSFCDIKHGMSGVIITQIPMNLNNATTGHKLQVSRVSFFCSKNHWSTAEILDNATLLGSWRIKLIVASFTKRWKNWIYILLSRVCTLAGLYLLEPLDEDNNTISKIPRELAKHNAGLRQLEAAMLKDCCTGMDQLGLWDQELEICIL